MRISALILSIVMLTSAAVTSGLSAENEIDLSAQSYILYCPQNGKTIASREPDKRMKPASTTKLMTTLLTLEEAERDDRIIEFTPEMAAEGSSMYLGFGEKVRLSDLAAGMMMASGNDAANAAALSISGSFEDFSALMNSRAAQIGMANTHFVTPSGLDDDDHYSSARDLALLMAEALKNESFRSLTAQKTATVDFVEPKDKRTTYSNHNRLLKDYEYCTGGKTGYTTAAGRCLVSSAQKDGVSLICVTLNDKNDWNDHKSLYDYGFDRLFRYESNDSGFCLKIPCVGGNAEAVTVTGEKDFALTPDADKKDCIERKVYIDSFLYAPIFSGKKVGRIEYTLNGELLEAVALVAVEDIFTE